LIPASPRRSGRRPCDRGPRTAICAAALADCGPRSYNCGTAGLGRGSKLVDGASVSCWWRSIPFLRLVQGFSSSRKPSSEWAICCAFGKPLR
jgi:hypothetical protein